MPAEARQGHGWLYVHNPTVLQRAVDVFGLSPDALGVLAALKTLGADLDQLEASAWAAAGLTAPQGWILTHLVLDGPCPQHQLAQRLMVTPSSISQVATRLEQHGLLTRRAGGDRRVRHLAATPAGRHRVEAVVPHVRHALEAAETTLGRAAVAHLTEQLALLHDALAQPVQPASTADPTR